MSCNGSGSAATLPVGISEEGEIKLQSGAEGADQYARQCRLDGTNDVGFQEYVCCTQSRYRDLKCFFFEAY